MENEELIKKIVIDNPNKISDMVEIIEVIIDTEVYHSLQELRVMMVRAIWIVQE